LLPSGNQGEGRIRPRCSNHRKEYVIVKRAAIFLVTAALTASALAACSSDNDGDDTAGSTASATARATPGSEVTAAPAEPNIDLACGRYYNGGDASLKVRIAAIVPVMEAQDAGTAPDDDQLAELSAIDSSLVLAIQVAPTPLADAYTAIHERIAGAVAAADSGEKNAATLDFPAQTKVITTECAAAGFPAS
jgi:hypothetical protein